MSGARKPVPADEAAARRAVVAHYEDALRRFGPTARGMDWKDEASQRLRFAVLCDGWDLDGRSVHEVGAGAGHLLDWLEEQGRGARYSGSDLSAEMVAAARALHADAPCERRFERRDWLTDPPDEHWDVVLCSGLFHVKLGWDDGAWLSFVHRMVRAMFERCRVGIAFNVMSDHVDFRAPDLFYPETGPLLDFCRRELSRSVVVRHDYPLHEVTFQVRREPREPGS